MDYPTFLATKRRAVEPAGFEPGELPPAMKGHQEAGARWACRMGRCGVFFDTGLGKTLMEFAILDQIVKRHNKPTLLFEPLGVVDQAIEEAAKFGIEGVRVARRQSDVTGPGIWVTNYQKLHNFEGGAFVGTALGEASILKSHDGKTRTALVNAFAATPYRFCLTAVPAPNDHEELGNYCEFLGVMSRVEMLSSYFIHDTADTSEWRLKGHAEGEFWRWVASWAILCRKPSDLGFADDGYDLPPLHVEEHWVACAAQEGQLIPAAETTLTGQRKARKVTLAGRVSTASEIVANADGPVLVWCELNAEGDALEKCMVECVQVAGKDADDAKIEKARRWKAGEVRTMISKCSVFGHGMNWQHCSEMVFVGLSHSYEQFYQAVRRCWRYGQTKPVTVHVVTSDLEAKVLANVKAKQSDHERMVEGMLKHTRSVNREQLGATVRQVDEYRTGTAEGRDWELFLGDNVETLVARPDGSIDYSIFSPPFASLFTYSNSPRDMGNCGNYGEFFNHFAHLTPHLFRTLKAGRLLSFHCMNLPTTKEHHGYIGIQDFRGDLIRAFQAAGFIYHSEVCIWKDPVTAMQRTKALGLLHKQLKKDSCMSRQGIADYVVTMRKPGANPEPVSHTNESFPVSVWQRYASPVWMDIDQQDVLPNYREGRHDDDERHLCPLQLPVIQRCIELWSNPGDVVLSPFAGIGSEGHVALRMGRKFVGCELKSSYFDVAVKNLKAAEREMGQATLLDMIGDDAA